MKKRLPWQWRYAPFAAMICFCAGCNVTSLQLQEFVFSTLIRVAVSTSINILEAFILSVFGSG